jgi:signal transduction histidine kinase
MRHKHGMRSLHARAFVVVAALVFALGALAFIVQVRSSGQYMLAMTQILNDALARRIVAEHFSPPPPGAASPETVKAQFSGLMAVNPAIELYLLDKDGLVLACTAPLSELRRQRVTLRPIQDFIEHVSVYPAFGDDPKDASRTKIFSAALLDPVHPEAGYLYVILGGSDYDAAARRIAGAEFFHNALVTTGLGAAVATCAAFLVLMTMTRRLRLLSRAIGAFRDSRFREPALVPVDVPRGGDELDDLAHAYNDMIGHIHAQMKEIADSNALRRDLIAGISHDLRTPLALLRGYLETLIMKDSTLTVADRLIYLGVASRQSMRMNHLVDELFELAKLEEIGVRIEPERFQLSELVQDVVQKFELTAKEKNITLRGQFMPEAPLALGDIPLIERMLDNLLENSIRYTPAGGRIDVKVTGGEKALYLEISDTGQGIPAQHLPHIFERFYRGDKARHAASGGAGLGLAIARRIVELHNGHISVVSQEGCGTTFRVELPSRPAQP